jgi:hypothetical protein
VNHAQLLPSLRRKIRSAIKGIPDEEPVDLVFLASTLANFNPTRMIPHWLVIVSGAGAGKTRLIETIQPWKRFVFTTVTAMTPGFFFAPKTSGKTSPLERMHEEGKRILLSRDATSFVSIDANTADIVYAQIRDIHDGYLYRETGTSSTARIYDPLPHERLGWIVASTPNWYAFQKRHHDLGTRFSVYYFDGFEDWTNVKDLLALDDGLGVDDTKVRQELSMDVIAYLKAALLNMDEWLPKVTYERHHSDRLASAVKLVMRILSAGNREGDTGKRLFFRAREMAIMLAFMHGRTLVSSLDTDIALRFIFSQILPEQQKFFQFCVLRNGAPVTRSELVEYAGSTLRIWDLRLKPLIELGVVSKSTVKGFGGKSSFGGAYRYTLSKEAAELVKTIALQVAQPAPKVESPQVALDRMVADEADKRGLIV